MTTKPVKSRRPAPRPFPSQTPGTQLLPGHSHIPERPKSALRISQSFQKELSDKRRIRSTSGRDVFLSEF